MSNKRSTTNLGIFASRQRMWQRKLLANIKRYTFVEVFRRGGKSITNSWMASRQLLLPIEEQTIPFFNPYLKQARANIVPYLKHFLHGYPDIKFNLSNYEVHNTRTNSRILLIGLGDSAESARGLGHGVHLGFADELSGYSSDDFHNILLPIFDGNRATLILSGTPPPTYDLFVAQRDWHRQQALLQPDLFAFHSFPVNTPEGREVFSQEEQDLFQRRSPSSFKREYLLDTSSGDETTFVSSEQLSILTQRDPNAYMATAPPVCGFDPALRNDDSIALIRVDHTIPVQPLDLSGTPAEQVQAVYKYVNANRTRHIAYDSTGLGEAFNEPFDRLCDRDRRLEVIPVNFASRARDPRTSANQRSELHYYMQHWLHLPSTCLPSSATLDLSKLLNELAAQVIKPNDKGLFQMERKEVIKQALGFSPGNSDALSLTFYDYEPEPHSTSEDIEAGTYDPNRPTGHAAYLQQDRSFANDKEFAPEWL